MALAARVLISTEASEPLAGSTIVKTLRASTSNVSLSRTNSVVTCTMSAATTNILVGDTVVISGAQPEDYNGEFTVTEVVSTTVYKYADPGKQDGGTTIAGTTGGHYSLMSTWESTEQDDLVANDWSHELHCYNDWPSGLDDDVDVAGWNTSTASGNTIAIKSATGHKHNGTDVTSGFYTIANNWNGRNIDIGVDHFSIDGIGVKTTTSASTAIYANNRANGYVSNCIVDMASAVGTGISGMRYIRNCLVYASGTKPSGQAGISGVWANTAITSNCTVSNLRVGFSTSTSLAINYHTFENCVAYDCFVDFLENSQEFHPTNCTNNASTDSTAPGTNSITGITSADFVDTANDDYRIHPDSDLYNAGTDLSGTFTTDIRGATRVTSNWDIGAYKIDIVTKTLKTSGGDYSSIVTWESTEQTDLVAAGEQHVLSCFTGTYTINGGVNIDGWTTDAVSYITVEAEPGSRHGGVWGAGVKFTNSTNWTYTFGVSQDYTVVDGVEAEHTTTLSGSSQAFVFAGTPAYPVIKNCLGQNSTTSITSGVFMDQGTYNSPGKWINCVARVNGSGTNDGFHVTNYDYPTAYNCTAINCYYGFIRDGVNGNDPTFINCVAYNSAVSDFASDTGSLSGNNNASGDTTVSTLSIGTVTGITSADFNDYDNGDYSPASGSDLIDAGTDLSSIFTDDIAGNTRGQCMAWEIGAYEYVSTGGVTVPLSGVQITSATGTPTVLLGQEVSLSGVQLTSATGIITVDTGSGWTVTDVDTDESIFEGQTGVIITISGTVSASGKTVWIEQSGNWVEQTVTAQDANSITITVVYGGLLVPGAANLYVRNPL